MLPLAHLIPLSLFAAGSYDLVRRQLRGAVSTLYRVAHLLLLPAAALTIILVIFPLVRVYSVALLPEDFDPDQIARYGWADRLRGERDYRIVAVEPSSCPSRAKPRRWPPSGRTKRGTEPPNRSRSKGSFSAAWNSENEGWMSSPPDGNIFGLHSRSSSR